jgi:hypothetical protein
MADQLDKPILPLSEKQMIHAKKRLPRRPTWQFHKIEGSWTINELITIIENLVPVKYRGVARINVESDRDGDYPPWLEISYNEEESDADWEERVTIAFRLDQQIQKEYKKNQDDKDFKEYARLKAKFDRKKA